MVAGSAPGSVGVLLQHIRHSGPCTKAELISMTGFARSTVNTKLDLLLSSGFVTAAGEALSTGGRRPTKFALNPTVQAVLAADVGATHITVAAVDLAGKVLATCSERFDIAVGPEPALDRVMQLGQQALSDAGLSELPIAGIGIGLPGPVEYATGKPTNPPIMPGWNGFDVPGYIRRTFDVPVLVDNDVNVMALGEHTTAWTDVPHLLFVKIATGIGAGIISDSRINRGSQGTAGDLGHVQVPGAQGRRCRCGNVGCLEAIASGPAIVERLRESGSQLHTTDELIEHVHGGDLQAIAAVRQAGREIGAVLASCVSLLNPSVIVIGGSMVGIGEHLLAGIREVVYQRALPLAAHNLRIVTSVAARQAGVVGAASMVIESVLAPEAVDRMMAHV